MTGCGGRATLKSRLISVSAGGSICAMLKTWTASHTFPCSTARDPSDSNGSACPVAVSDTANARSPPMWRSSPCLARITRTGTVVGHNAIGHRTHPPDSRLRSSSHMSFEMLLPSLNNLRDVQRYGASVVSSQPGTTRCRGAHAGSLHLVPHAQPGPSFAHVAHQYTDCGPAQRVFLKKHL